MKRVGNLFETAFTFDNLMAAYEDAKKGKSKKPGCYLFSKNVVSNIDNLHSRLHSNTYTPQPYHQFLVFEPKCRVIYAPSFTDLVVQHAIYRVVYEIFDRSFIDQSYACRLGKGTHKAANYAQKALWMSDASSYVLKMDIRKFFYRIDRGVLRKQIERKIKDRRFVDVMMMFAEYGEPVGIPIGNLLSQLYALIYMNPLDHFIKRKLKAKLYVRYVDDFVIFGHSRRECIEFLSKIVDFITDHGLELSKFSITPSSRGINFVGYRTWRSKRFIRRHSVFKFTKSYKKSKLDSIISILGHARHTHSLNSLINSLRSNSYDNYIRLPKTYHRNSHNRINIS